MNDLQIRKIVNSKCNYTIEILVLIMQRDAEKDKLIISYEVKYTNNYRAMKPKHGNLNRKYFFNSERYIL